MLVCCASTYAIQTTQTSSIYINNETGYSNMQSNNNIPTTIRRVRFINHLNSNPESDIALTNAEYIFSYMMKSESIDLVPIIAIVEYGNISDFEINEVCKVSVQYTDTIVDNSNYHYFSLYANSDTPILIPKTIFNQCRGISSGPSINISLNPNISYHFDTTPVPENKCDAITIFLRALSIGCGIQSARIKYITGWNIY